MPRNIAKYEATIEIAAPVIPYGGIRIRLSATLKRAAAPVIIQFEPRRPARPIDVTTTTYMPKTTKANTSSGTTRSPP